MAIKSFFPTFIYYEDLQKKKAAGLNSDLLEACYQIRDYDKKGRKWCETNYVGGYTSYASLAQLHNFSSVFSDLEKKITKHVYQYAKELEVDLGGRGLQMSDCWLNMMPANTAHGLHLHPLSFISGTYYVHTPKGCSDIKFEDPRLSSFMAAPPKKTNCSDKNKTFVSVKAEVGKLVLFESWLRHEVPASRSAEERVSISFNYSWG